MKEKMDRETLWVGKAWANFSARYDPAAQILTVDVLAIAIAISLPWSTSAVLIFVALWIVALSWTIVPITFVKFLSSSICVAPLAIVVLALIGTLWSDAAWDERLHAVGPVTKLLAMPLLFYHFQRTKRGAWVLSAFLFSSALLMMGSWVVTFVPSLTLKSYIERGVVVKNHIDQSHIFALCSVALVWPISILSRAKRVLLAGVLVGLALGFVANLDFVNVSRTALITLPVIVAVVVLHRLTWRNAITAFCALTLFGLLSWSFSPVLRAKTASLLPPYRLYEPASLPTSIEIRLEYWRKSIAFIRDAPLIGHGTGSIRPLFEKAAIGQIGTSAEITANPHNQTLNVAIEWGAVGVLALYALWVSHLALFRGPGWASWVGLLILIQNIVSSVFNSHLFDFLEGWIYVLGVGVTGGMVLGASRCSTMLQKSLGPFVVQKATV